MSAPAVCDLCGATPLPACEVFGVQYQAERLVFVPGFTDLQPGRGWVQGDQWLCPTCFYAERDAYDEWCQTA